MKLLRFFIVSELSEGNVLVNEAFVVAFKVAWFFSSEGLRRSEFNKAALHTDSHGLKRRGSDRLPSQRPREENEIVLDKFTRMTHEALIRSLHLARRCHSHAKLGQLQKLPARESPEPSGFRMQINADADRALFFFVYILRTRTGVTLHALARHHPTIPYLNRIRIDLHQSLQSINHKVTFPAN